MDIVFGFGLCFCILLFSVMRGIYLLIPLTFCYIVFFIIAIRKGSTPRELFRLTVDSVKRSALILQIFTLIGCIMSIWISCGTLPAIIYYSLSYLNPNIFILLAFALTALVSFFIGSSFGAASTIGVALITLAKSGGLPLPIVTGAIMSGIYFGDRSSFVSSAAALTATVCKADHSTNVRNMLRSTVIPTAVCCLLYGGLSLLYPMQIEGSQLPSILQESFYIHPILLLPALLMFLLPAMKLNVKLSMAISIVCSFGLGVFFQHGDPLTMLRGMLLGVSFSEGPMADILSSGGVWSMLTTYFCLMASFALASMFEQVHAFDSMRRLVTTRIKNERSRFGFSTLMSLLGTAFGCNQTMSIIAGHDIMAPCYDDDPQGRQQFALDLSNCAVILPGLIPWSLACFVPIAMLGVENVTFMPFAFYLYGTPLLTFFFYPIVGRIAKGHSPEEVPQSSAKCPPAPSGH